MFVNGKVNFRHEQMEEKLDFKNDEIWLWVCLSKENLTLDMSKYNL
jgi:hypothetical protein